MYPRHHTLSAAIHFKRNAENVEHMAKMEEKEEETENTEKENWLTPLRP